MIASGRFDVTVTPIPADDADGGPFRRYLMAKRMHGDLEAESRGQMLGAESPVKGSGAGVAFELVTGTLHGRRGSFILQHKSTMRAGAGFQMDISVVPDSGTGELTGIEGTFAILFEGKDHRYRFDYTLEGK